MASPVWARRPVASVRFHSTSAIGRQAGRSPACEGAPVRVPASIDLGGEIDVDRHDVRAVILLVAHRRRIVPEQA